jgi:hypothetical protein
MIAHGQGIHHIHIYGWIVGHWCPTCRHQWESFRTADLRPKARFRQLADAELARSVLEAIERGEIGPPPGFALPEEIPSIFTRIVPSPN